MKIWSLGDAVIDLIPLENMQYQACAGGPLSMLLLALLSLAIQADLLVESEKIHLVILCKKPYLT